MIGDLLDLTPTAWSIALFVLGWSAGWFLLWRPHHLPQRRDRHRPTLAVIVPARDEAASLPALLESVRTQLAAGDELIVVDDHSTDATATVARDRGARIIAAPDLPSGWAGKPHACHIGATHAHPGPRVLVFTDADVVLGPGVLDRVAAEVMVDPTALMSVQPWHTPGSWPEQLSMLPNLLALMGSAAFTPLGPRRGAQVAFGPVLACTREAYDRAGGHAHPDVRGTILEDIALARRFPSTRLHVGRRDEVTFRMYRTPRAMFDGWTKGIAIGLHATPWWARAMSVAWVASLAGGWLTSPWFALASLVQLAVLTRRAGRFSALAIVTYPIGVLFLAVVVLRSAARRWGGRRGTVTWKGRDLRPDQPVG